jgi:hypothetical protein
VLAIEFSSSLASAASIDTPAISYDWGQWQFATSANYLSTTANYTKSGGEYVDLPSGYSYSLAQFDFLTRWVALPNMGVTASTQLAYAESKDYRDTRTNSSITEAYIGVDYQILSKKLWELYADLSLTFPLQRVDQKSDDVLNHEGSMNLRPGVGFRYWLGKSVLYATSGFVYRDEDRSSFLDYAFGTEVNLSHWLLGAELGGFSTVIKDSRTNALQRELVFAKNGNSLKFYSADPSVLFIKAWIGKEIGNDWQFKAGLSNSITGSAYAAGIDIFARLIWTPNAFKKSAPAYRESKKQVSPSEFHEDTIDGVDQQIFESIPPIDQPPIQPVKPPPPPPQELPKSLQPPPRPKPGKTKEQLKQELDQTEFQIELKTTKKKKKKPKR